MDNIKNFRDAYIKSDHRYPVRILKALNVIARTRNAGITIHVNGDNLVIESLEEAKMFINDLKTYKAEILRLCGLQ
jgi:hypothetical protein